MDLTYSKLVHGTPSYEDFFVVNWCFFTICNFKCTYCPPNLHDGKHRGLDIELVKNFVHKTIAAKPGKKIFFEFTGGEMTYYRNFVELFEFLKENNVETGLITNGSRDLAFWEKHKHLLDHVCLSFHPEEGDPEHFFNVVKILNEVTTLHVNIMMLPSKFDMLLDLAKKIASEFEGMSLALQALFENMSDGMFAYTPEQKEILERPSLPWGQNVLYRKPAGLKRKVYRGEMHKEYSNGHREVADPPKIIASGENTWKGWKCNMGLENLVINSNGDIMGGWCAVGGVIGNVSDAEFQFPTQPVICSVPKCFCGFDVMSTKERIV